MVLNKEFYIIYDIVLILWAIFDLYRGYRKGGFRFIIGIVGSLLSLGIAYVFCNKMVIEYPILDKQIPIIEFELDLILWFLILFVSSKVVWSLIMRIIMGKRDDSKVTFLSRLLGLLLAAVKVFVIYTLITLLCLSPWIKDGNRFVNQGPLYYVKEFIIDHRGDVGIDV
ncbi:MAG: CvpA family protein [Holdemanella sp.]|nr:CvpA family protein [Holdemanella sp.]